MPYERRRGCIPQGLKGFLSPAKDFSRLRRGRVQEPGQLGLSPGSGCQNGLLSPYKYSLIGSAIREGLFVSLDHPFTIGSNR